MHKFTIEVVTEDSVSKDEVVRELRNILNYLIAQSSKVTDVILYSNELDEESSSHDIA